MASRFSFNQEITANGYKAKIVSVRGNAFDGYTYRVKFLNSSLIPNEMEFSESVLVKQNPPIAKDDLFCPVCSTPWKVVKFNMQTWKDCVKCNKTYEQIMKEKKESTNSYSKSKDQSELGLDGFFPDGLWDDDIDFFD